MVPRTDQRSFLAKHLPKTLADLIGIKTPDISQLPDTEIVASKCDLCAGVDKVPACVRSCPTGAAQRVDPIQHFLNK